MAKRTLVGSLSARHELAVLDTVRSLLASKGSRVWSISPSATVYEAIAEMAKRSVGALPVLLEGRLIGIISERDYARKVILQGRSSHDTFVREIMTLSPVWVAPHHTVAHCLKIMTNRRIRHLPVLEHGKVAGILSIGDLVKAIIETQAFTIDQLQTYIATGYPS